MIQSENGLTLVETLLVTAMTLALLSAGAAVYKRSNVSAHTKAEASNITTLADKIQNSYGFVSNYGGISTARVANELLAPEVMRNGENLWSAWGSVFIEPYGPDGGFQIRYLDVPKANCAPLASAVSDGAFDIEINGTSTKTLTPAGVKAFNPITAQANCSENNELIFIFGRDWSSSSIAADPLDLPPPPVEQGPANQSPVTVIVPSAPGVADATMTPSPQPTQTSSIIIPTIPVPEAVTPSTPNPAPALPAPSPAPAVTTISQCVDGYQDRTLFCSSGQWGSLLQRQILACEVAANPGVYEAWVPAANRIAKSWNTVSGSCTTCPAATTESRTQWVAFSQNNCAAGSYGSTQWEREQRSQRSVTYNCPAGTTSLPAATAGSWSGWVNTGTTRQTSSACAACPAPTTESRTQWVAAADSACPAGQTGRIANERQQISYRTNSYNCPAGTASLPAATVGGWGGWSDTGATRVVSNSCVALPPATPLGFMCVIKGPGSIERESANGCSVTVDLRGSTGTVTARFELTGDTSNYSINWSGDCTGTGASCLNNTTSLSSGRPLRDFVVNWTATHISGSVQSGTINASYGER